MISNRKIYFTLKINYIFKNGNILSSTLSEEELDRLNSEKYKELERIRNKHEGCLSLIIVNDIVQTMERTIDNTGELEILSDEYNEDNIPHNFIKNLLN